MPVEPHELLGLVEDEQTFLAFARALHADRLRAIATPTSDGWENGTIEDFLDGAIAWAEASDLGRSQGLSQSNPWKRFATFLYCGKIYE